MARRAAESPRSTASSNGNPASTDLTTGALRYRSKFSILDQNSFGSKKGKYGRTGRKVGGSLRPALSKFSAMYDRLTSRIRRAAVGPLAQKSGRVRRQAATRRTTQIPTTPEPAISAGAGSYR